VLENKKKDSGKPLSPKMETKKGKSTPTLSEALLPVIFSIIVLAIYLVKVRLPLINRGVF
jgi:hypothetical protein